MPFEEEYADEWAGAPPQDDRNLGHPALLAREDWEPSASDEDSEDNGDEKEEELELSQREKTIKACMLLSRQLIDEIANGGVHQTSAVRVLSLFKHHLGPLLSDDVMDELPDSLHMLKKVAELVEVSSFMRHFCPFGCRMFVGDSGPQEKCGLCPPRKVGWRYDDHGRPMCECLYFSLDAWAEGMLAVPELARAFAGFSNRAQSHTPGVYRESSDGSIIRQFFDEHGPNCWPFEQCNDAVVKWVAAAMSFTPLVFHCHALPFAKRTAFGGVYFAAAFPTSAKMTQVFFQPTIAMFAARSPVDGSPLRLTTALGVELSVYFWICWIVNDVRGMEKLLWLPNPPPITEHATSVG